MTTSLKENTMTNEPTAVAAHLIGAMSVVAATRCMVTITDWKNPAHVEAAEDGIRGCLDIIMSMLEHVADGMECRDAADQRINAATDQAWSIIASNQKGARA